MIEFVTDRNKIVRQVLSILKPEYTEEELQYYSTIWWRNYRTLGGLCLSDSGRTAFEKADLQYWEFIINYNFSTLLLLTRRCPCPYYHPQVLGKKTTPLRLYDSRIASMMILYDNDITSLLNTFSDIGTQS